MIGTLVFVLAVGQLGKGAHPGAEEKNAAHENAGGDHPLEWLADTLSDSAHLLDTRKWGRDPEVNIIIYPFAAHLNEKVSLSCT